MEVIGFKTIANLIMSFNQRLTRELLPDINDVGGKRDVNKN